MCGRFVLTHPSDALARIFDAVPDNALPDVPNYNTCPTTQIHAVTLQDGTRRLRGLRWGLIPRWAKTESDGPLLINARSETVADKPAFRDAVRKRRCLVPATGFYEWTKDDKGNRLPWYIAPEGDAPLAFAGIWQDWTGGDEAISTCAILTCAANTPMAAIHDRMPVIVAPDDWPLWLGEAGKGAADLMRPAPGGLLRMYRVDPRVNSARARGAELIEPLEL
ncbi:SOS response-associated peptidase [Maribius pontilimi]|uniref:Abasic site processing protein n=1 Tax=Palleronia pontilimi TaxID=1964209 RepID=A0A934MGR3_9RHOB|nr:SOS response-associated peptidase [Palleronia pontilimi]MBJ3762634.1 SOS response-associated peptidase [Palleronia pontilimi]